ncbi:DNA damage-inducible protein D [Dielma fastidiosa]|uniref:DNA damage-inducible protein D n=1 Tax=Dielma fastidiosa TaxID=1034346 RepID=A0A318KT74_9FIRM|nr:DNA damage-inducible protein D [Dielma fastidiosa]MDY5169066.1 DNA damage-inducible protein D [Dielma fastidiosa]PXX80940.1 DNA-damage-inducible protein D [Dielma fastidiosa]HAH93147.1 DNA damage-inducible protein D [Dielma fastidiosa]
MATLIATEYKQFEDIKHTDENGIEFWYARELSPVLDYTKWENFNKVIDKAMLSCQNSGFECADHFLEVRKMVQLGSGSERKVKDYELSRYACYLIVQNGDPRKETIALGQTYFAIQTRRQEIADAFNELDEDKKRLVIRGEVTSWNAMLAEAANQAGITDQLEYAQFQNAGYMGLYGGLTAADIHKRKKLKKSEKILDHMGSEELGANLFRITQTEAKLRREQPQGLEMASGIHYQVGQTVREAIAKNEGTMPEDLPTPEKSIAEIGKEQLKKLKEKKEPLILDE